MPARLAGDETAVNGVACDRSVKRSQRATSELGPMSFKMTSERLRAEEIRMTGKTGCCCVSTGPLPFS